MRGDETQNAVDLNRRQLIGAGIAGGAALLFSGSVGARAAQAATTSTTSVVPRTALVPGRTVNVQLAQATDLLGAPASALKGKGVQLRALAANGSWGRWHDLAGSEGHAPDGDPNSSSEPIWLGGSSQIQMRVAKQPERDIDLSLISVGQQEKQRSAAAVRAVRAQRPSATATARSATGRAVVQPTIIPRSAWGLGLKGASGQTGTVQMAFVHHTAGTNEYQPSESSAIIRSIYTYHTATNGWSDIGYNFLVDRYGQIFEGRAGGITSPIVGAHAIGWNSFSTGIAILGDFTATAVPEAAIIAVSQLISWKLALHGVPTAGTVTLTSRGGSGNRFPSGAVVSLSRVSGHQDGCSTDCPGSQLYALLPRIRGSIANPIPLTLNVNSQSPVYGSALTATGKLTSAGLAVANTQVVLEKTGKSGGWVSMGSAVTDADGNWQAATKWLASGKVRARSGTVTSEAINVGITPQIDFPQPSTRVKTGSKLPLKGHARGTTQQVQLVLRRKIGSKYKYSKRVNLALKKKTFRTSLRVSKKGSYSVTAQVYDRGKYYYSPARYFTGL